MSKNNIVNESNKALLWSFSERIGYQVINFLVILILARFLEPKDFGIISLLMSIIYILNVFMDGGFGILIIQKQEISDNDLSTIFYTNMTIGLVFYFILWVFSRNIGIFFQEPYLDKYLKVISLVLIINSFSIVQFSLIEKELKFKKLFIVNVLSLLTSSVATVYFAFLGLGVWSLVFFQLIGSLIRTILVNYLSDWSPKLVFDMKSLKSSWRFSKNILFSSLIDSVYQKGINFFIGKISSTVELGFYEQASKTKEIPAAAIASSTRRVLFPMFSRFQDQSEKVKIDFKIGIKLLAFLAIPLTFMFNMFSDFIVIVLFSKKWLASSYYLELLSFTILPYVLFYMNIDLFKAKGNSSMYMRINIITKSIGFILIIIASLFGLKYVLYSFILVHWFSYLFSSYFTKENLGYTLIEQIIDLLPFISYGAISFIVTKVIFRLFVIDNFYLSNSITILSFLIIYCMMAYSFSIKSMKEILKFLFK
jgi:O-antigen/teichoic acid export membrane protein